MGPAQVRELAMKTVPLDAVHPHPDNVRDRLTGLEELAQSIRSVGILQPLTVAPDGGGYLLVAGHRRHAAARLAGLSEVPVNVRADLVGERLAEAMLIENLHRVDLSPVEEAKALRLLLDLNGDLQQDLAAKLGKPGSWVSSRLALLRLPPELQGRLTAKEITLRQAVALARSLNGRAPGEVDPDWNRPHFGNRHPLAAAAKARCGRLGHVCRRPIGGVSCGQCWEAVIREDERKLARHARPASSRGRGGDVDVEVPAAKQKGLPRMPGEVRLSDGSLADVTIDKPTGECGECGEPLSRSLGCACDPGLYGDDEEPLDPRWATGVFADDRKLVAS